MIEKMKHDSLGNRMKMYENTYRYHLLRKVPVIVRVDGRAFHSLTRHMSKPFDPGFMDSMISAAIHTAEGMQGFKLGYVQSDESSFLLHDFDHDETEAWFDYNINKVVSISASTMSVYFNLALSRYTQDFGSLGVFDGRSHNIPNEDTPNYFFWRYQDCKRNSLQMYCQSFFSHKQLHGKGWSDQHVMLHGIGKNWTTGLSWREKNGTFIFPGGKTSNDFVNPNYYDIDYMQIDKWINKNPFKVEASNG